jgi:multidrug transporter EmrE-like cation transporter
MAREEHSMIDLADALRLIHPAIAVAVVFPLIGMTLHMAWQTRQRRLQTVEGGKSKIPPVVGPEHLKLGRVLAGAVVGICLLGMTHPTIKYMIKENLWDKDKFQVISIVLLLIATIASFVFLYQAREKLWRGIFATLTGMGVVILGIQDIVFKRQGFGAIFRRDDEWFVSHFYSGMAATMLMIFSLAIIQDIYQDRSNRWRIVHTVLNSIALLLFLGQAMTGVRDLLEIPLGWQEPTIYGCDYVKKVCPPFKQSSLDIYPNTPNI